ncbi:MAG: hypothetical protein FWG99_02880 [Treponema sp.]|nr:hypothetical protein [Treponema sp.]
MKKIIVLTAAIALAACTSGNYPDFEYTNNSGSAVEFRTSEKDSPLHRVENGRRYTLSSDVRGRSRITYISEPFVTWEYRNNDVYDIVFLKHEIQLTIKNYSAETVVVKEKFNLLSHLAQSEIILGPGGSQNDTVNAVLHTFKPVWKTSPESARLRLVNRDSGEQYSVGFNEIAAGSAYMLGIGRPPAGEWWK